MDMRYLKQLIVLAILLTNTVAHAAWPERRITLVVPYAPGGITDVLARLTAEQLQMALSQTVIVENQSGASGTIAARRVAHAEPDGYTLFFSTITQICVAPFINNIEYDPIKDFAPISGVATSPFVITVGKAVPANTLKEFVDYVKANPRKLSYGAAGSSSFSNISAAIMLKRAGIDMVMVPYQGLGPAFIDLLAGNIQMVSATPIELKPFIGTGNVKLLASSGPERSSLLPNVPTIAESYQGYSVLTWNGVLAPAKTPQPIIDSLSRVIMAAERSPEFRAKLTQLGVDPVVQTPGAFSKQIAIETETWRKIVDEMHLSQK